MLCSDTPSTSCLKIAESCEICPETWVAPRAFTCFPDLLCFTVSTFRWRDTREKLPQSASRICYHGSASVGSVLTFNKVVIGPGMDIPLSSASVPNPMALLDHSTTSRFTKHCGNHRARLVADTAGETDHNAERAMMVSFGCCWNLGSQYMWTARNMPNSL